MNKRFASLAVSALLLVSMFSHKFSPRIVTAMNRVCGAVVVLYGVKLLIDFVMAVL